MKRILLVLLSIFCLVNIGYAYTVDIFLIGSIDDTMQNNLSVQFDTVMLNAWMHQETVTDCVVHITSGGGSVYNSIAIYNWIRYYVAGKGIKVHTVANGYCMFGAVVVLQAGDERCAVKNTTIATHNVRAMVSKDTVLERDEIRKLYKDLDELTDQMIMIFSKRMGINKLMLSIYFQDELFPMDAYTAKQLRFIDTVIETPYNWMSRNKGE